LIRKKRGVARIPPKHERAIPRERLSYLSDGSASPDDQETGAELAQLAVPAGRPR